MSLRVGLVPRRPDRNACRDPDMYRRRCRSYTPRQPTSRRSRATYRRQSQHQMGRDRAPDSRQSGSGSPQPKSLSIRTSRASQSSTMCSTARTAHLRVTGGLPCRSAQPERKPTLKSLQPNPRSTRTTAARPTATRHDSSAPGPLRSTRVAPQVVPGSIHGSQDSHRPPTGTPVRTHRRSGALVVVEHCLSAAHRSDHVAENAGPVTPHVLPIMHNNAAAIVAALFMPQR